ncbi:MAG: hypothetical protein KQA36_00520 [Candidatus Aenigmarchaeota archaeon]|nr:hypothetical protein [Candidatus Aenigmarchaeota archaeon]
MLVFSIVNCAIDLENEIVSNIRAETKQSYKNIFEILKKNKIINEKENDFSKILHYLTKKLFTGIKKLKVLKNLERIVREI